MDTPTPLPKEFIAYNSTTKSYFVKGKGFVGGSASVGSLLDKVEMAVLRATYENVAIYQQRCPVEEVVPPSPKTAPLKRFDPVEYCDQGCRGYGQVEEAPDGDYVRFEDAQQEIRLRNECIRNLIRDISSMTPSQLLKSDSYQKAIELCSD